MAAPDMQYADEFGIVSIQHFIKATDNVECI